MASIVNKMKTVWVEKEGSIKSKENGGGKEKKKKKWKKLATFFF